MREEREALEDIADAAALRREIHAGHGVEEHLPIRGDASLVRPHQPGQALERQALAGAGRAEEHGDTVARAPLDVEREPGNASGSDVEPRGSCRPAGRAGRAGPHQSTAQESKVRSPTSASASPVSPVSTAV